MTFKMKTWRLVFLVWLAGTSWAGAQMSQTLNGQSINQRFGASPSSPPQMFQGQLKPAGQSATGNTTTNKPTTGLPNLLNPPDTTAPALSGNVAALPVPAVPAPANSSYNGGDLSSFPMPETMEQIDNQRTLTVSDQFVYRVLEDHDAPLLRFVDEKGEIAPSVPYLPSLHLKVTGRTLYEVATKLKELLEDPKQVPAEAKLAPEDAKLGLYKRATVLLAFYQGNGTRGQVMVTGEVPKQGYVDVPANKVLTLFQAINDAGGFKDSADKEHVQLTHYDLDDASKNTPQIIDFQKFLNGDAPEPNFVVQPGDLIKVPAKGEGIQQGITINGEVRSPTVLPPPNGRPLYLSEVMLQVGFTDWSNHTIQLIRFIDSKKTITDYDVDEVLVKGNKDKDVLLQPGDHIYVKRNWWSFGG
jgi:protein involved in polysaccharide export with SLBB domain